MPVICSKPDFWVEASEPKGRAMLVRCECGWEKTVKDELAGRKAQCPKCSSTFVLQEAASLLKKQTPAVEHSPAPPIRTRDPDVITRPITPPTIVTRTSSAEPPSALESVIGRLTAEDQDSEKTTVIFDRVQQILTTNESILYIAIQAKPIANWFPDAVVLSSRRFIIYRPKMLGRVEFEDSLWRELKDCQMKEDMIGATVTFEVTDGRRFMIDYLPKKQARQLYRISQEQEEAAHEERRNRTMEEGRAHASNIVVQNAVQPSSPNAGVASVDPVARLTQLKQMLDAGLISTDEYDAKKSAILQQM